MFTTPSPPAAVLERAFYAPLCRDIVLLIDAHGPRHTEDLAGLMGLEQSTSELRFALSHMVQRGILVKGARGYQLAATEFAELARRAAASR